MAKNQQQKQKKLQLKAAKRKKRELEKKKKEILRKQQDQLNDLIAYSLQLVQEKSYYEAEKLLNKALSAHPDEGYIYYAYGLLYVTSGHSDKGIIALEKSIPLDPKFAPSYYNLAMAYYKSTYLHKMLDTLNQMFDQASYDEECFTLGKKLIKDTEEMIKKNDNISLEDYCNNQRIFDQAFTLMSEKNYEQAISSFSSLLAVDATHVASHGNIGICYSQLGQRDLAIEFFDKALELDPNYELALFNKTIIEGQEESEIIGSEMQSMEYYKDFPLQNKSLFEDIKMKLSHQK